jgi:hypothetical protein
MDQAHDITFRLAVFMLVCPIMDGMAAPVTQVGTSGDLWKGNLLVMFTLAAIVLSTSYVSRKLRRHE